MSGLQASIRSTVQCTVSGASAIAADPASSNPAIKVPASARIATSRFRAGRTVGHPSVGVNLWRD